MYKIKFNSVSEILPKEELEIILYNEEWIDDNYNPNGFRVGFLSEGVWVSSSWSSYYDRYETRSSGEDDASGKHPAIDQIPTHWVEFPEFSLEETNNFIQSNNKEVQDLLKQHEEIEKKINKLDKNALLNYKFEKISKGNMK